MRLRKTILITLLGILVFTSCNHEEASPVFKLEAVYMGTQTLNIEGGLSTGMPIDQPVVLAFSNPINTNTLSAITVMKENQQIDIDYSFFDNNRSISLTPTASLETNSIYTIVIGNELEDKNNQNFSGSSITFKTLVGTLSITSLKFDDEETLNTTLITDVDQTLDLEITFSDPIEESTIGAIQVTNASGSITLQPTFSENNTKVTFTHSGSLSHLSRHRLVISGTLKGENEESFASYSKYFYTEVDPTPKFPVVSDDELLTLVQQQTLKYFYDFAHPASGMARERNTSGDIVTVGGSGFGLMALIVGMERGFISRNSGLTQLATILTFLETCDRFHGAWPHWLNGNTGDIVPFSATDDGGDLVETSFMIQGLITMRQYLDAGVPAENTLISRINDLINDVEYDWYTNGENVLYWLWSPNNGYILKIQGHNETLITYLLAAASTTHPVSAATYTIGYSRGGAILNGNSYYSILLPLGQPYGGPLFFTHYSFLGLNPSNLSDQFANYWTQNVNHTLINQAYCEDNSKNFIGYSDECWGLTASDNHIGYSAHSPTNDLGVITPTAALSSFPYTPTESMKALKFFYYTYGDKLWGNYGFYDAFNITAGWTANSYLAIDQGPIIVMIENYRTGLLWNLFMSAPEVQDALNKLDFNY